MAAKTKKKKTTSRAKPVKSTRRPLPAKKKPASRKKTAIRKHTARVGAKKAVKKTAKKITRSATSKKAKKKTATRRIRSVARARSSAVIIPVMTDADIDALFDTIITDSTANNDTSTQPAPAIPAVPDEADQELEDLLDEVFGGAPASEQPQETPVSAQAADSYADIHEHIDALLAGLGDEDDVAAGGEIADEEEPTPEELQGVSLPEEDISDETLDQLIESIFAQPVASIQSVAYPTTPLFPSVACEPKPAMESALAEHDTDSDDDRTYAFADARRSAWRNLLAYATVGVTALLVLGVWWKTTSELVFVKNEKQPEGFIEMTKQAITETNAQVAGFKEQAAVPTAEDAAKRQETLDQFNKILIQEVYKEAGTMK